MNALNTLLGTAGAVLLLAAATSGTQAVSAQEVKNLTDLVVTEDRPAISDRSALGELKYWNSIKDTNDAEMFRSYLESFPDGMFTDPALARYQQLTGQPFDGKLPAAGSQIESEIALISPEEGTEQVVEPKPKPVASSQTKKAKKIVKKKTKKKTAVRKKSKPVVATAPQKSKAVKRKTAAKKNKCSVQTADGNQCPVKVATRKKPRIEMGGGGGGGWSN